MSRPVLPAPKRREAGLGVYRPAAETRILLGPGHDPDLRRMARDLQAQLHAVGAGHFPIAARFGMDDAVKPIMLLQWPHDVAAAPRIASALPEPHGEEGYVLDITPERIVVLGEPPGLFYAVQTLRQLVGPGGRVRAERITDWPTLPLRGVMVDVARGKVPQMETLYQAVDLLARCKMNVFQLYNESAFAWQRHPRIGADGAQLTADQLLALDSYCADRHVDFIPALQSLGHATGILKLDAYAHLDETGRQWTLSPAEPGTYDLLADLYAEYLPNFQSRFFNACCDEPWDLGEGRSASLARTRTRIGLYLDHVLRLRDMARAYDKQLMIWGDMVIAHPACLKELPDDIVVLDWWYEAEHDYDRVARYAASQQPFFVCPGTSTWNSFTPRLPNALANIEHSAAAAVAHGASGLLCTDWGDNGHFNCAGTAWYSSAYACAAAWAGPGLDRRAFDRAFGSFAFSDPQGTAARAYRALGATHAAAALPSFNSSPYFNVLFESVEQGPFADDFTPRKQRKAGTALDRADRALRTARDALEGTGATYLELRWGNAMQRHAIAHAALVRAERAARAGRASLPTGERRREARRLARRLTRLREQFAELWLLRNRPGGLDRALARLDAVIAAYDGIGRRT